MLQHFLNWLNQNNENKAIAGLILVIIGALLKELVPLAFGALGKLLLFFGRLIGGRVGFRYFERLYLNWLVTELRELKLTGIASADASKKPTLEQVFVSLRIAEQRGLSSPVQTTLAIVDDMKRRRTLDHSLIRELKRDLELATPALRKDAEQILASYLLSRRKHIRRILTFFKRSKAVLSDNAVIESVLSDHDDAPDAATDSTDYGGALLRKILSDEKRIAILGTPGAGKTTLLQYIGVAYARSRAGDIKLRNRKAHKHRLGAPDWRIPIFVSLGSVAKKLMTALPDGREPSLLDVLVATLPPDLQEPIATTYFTRQIKKGRCIVLLDGLDEVPTDEEFRAVVRAIEGLVIVGVGNQFVVTSRIAGWRTGINSDFKQFYVSELTENQISSFINTWYSAVELNAVLGRLEDEGETDRRNRERKSAKQASKLKTVLKENPGLRQLSTNPMLLSIIALVHHSLATLPQERGKLYAECTKILLEQWDMSRGLRLDDTGLKLDQKEAIMRRFAFALHTGEIGREGGGREASRSEVIELLATLLPDFGRSPSEAPHLLQILVDRSGIIAERQRDVLAFAHLTFQEYFTARYFARGDRSGNSASLLSPERLHSDWWREVILLYSSMLPDSSDFVTAVHKSEYEDLLKSKLRLAAWCLGESVQVRQASVRHALAQDLIRIRSRGTIVSISSEIPNEVVAYLINWSKDEDWYSYALVQGIRDSKDLSELEKARSFVLSLLSSTQVSKVRAAIKTISRAPLSFSNGDILVEIVQLIRRPDAEIASAAARCLEHIWTDSASGALQVVFVDAFQREDISTICGLLSLIRTKAICVISKISGRLIEQLLTHSNWRIREEAAKLFSYIAPNASAHVIGDFLRLLHDDDLDVAKAARGALCAAMRSSPRDALIEHAIALLRHPRTSGRLSAVTALAELDKQTALKYEIIAKLAMMFSDKSDAVRTALIEAFHTLASKTLGTEIAATIVKFITGHGHAGRGCAINTAVRLGPSTATAKVREAVLAQLKERHTDVREAAISAITELKLVSLDEDTFVQLVAAASNHKSRIRAAAINTLGAMGGKHHREEILKLIRSAFYDKNRTVRNAAAKACKRYGRAGRRFIDPLLAEVAKQPKKRAAFRFLELIGDKEFPSGIFLWSPLTVIYYYNLLEALASIAVHVETDRVIEKLVSLVPLTSSIPIMWHPLLVTLGNLGAKGGSPAAFSGILELYNKIGDHFVYRDDLQNATGNGFYQHLGQFDIRTFPGDGPNLRVSEVFSAKLQPVEALLSCARSMPRNIVISQMAAACDAGPLLTKIDLLRIIPKLDSSMWSELLPMVVKRVIDDSSIVRREAWLVLRHIYVTKGTWKLKPRVDIESA